MSLLKVSQCFYQSVRHASHKWKKKNLVHRYKMLKHNFYPEEPVLETYGMKYYPRDPDHKDPPIEPSKLFLVERVKPLKGTPWYDRHTLARLNLDGRDRDYVVLKNIPNVNRNLWKVKHLVKVTAVTFPNGEPSEADIERTFVNRQSGEMIVSDAAAIDPARIKGFEDIVNDPTSLDKQTLDKESRHRWLSAW